MLYCLKTCVTQDYDQLTILVSDNCSQDDTREVTHSFNDPRIRYVNTRERVSMTHNWEFALSHVEKGFVTFLGDDDGFLPGSVQKAAAWLAETNARAINLNPADYLWPSFFNSERANTLYIKFRSGYHLLDGGKELRKTLAGTKSYSGLPCIYNSFIERSLLTQVQKTTNTFFHSRIPDVYSAIALSQIVGPYVYADESLKLYGTSKKSTGASLLHDAVNQQAAKAFMSENNLPIHPKLSSTLGRSISLIIAESFMQSFDQGLNQNLAQNFDLQLFMRQALQEAFTTALGHKDEVISNVMEICAKNGIPATEFDALIKQYEHKTPGPVSHEVSRFFQPFALVDAASYGVSDIAGAAELYDKIYRHPLRYPGIISSTIRKTLKSATAEMLLKRLKG